MPQARSLASDGFSPPVYQSQHDELLLNQPCCQILKFYKVIEVTRFGTVIWRVQSQGKGIASLDGSDGDAASTYKLRPLRISSPEFHVRSDSE